MIFDFKKRWLGFSIKYQDDLAVHSSSEPALGGMIRKKLDAIKKKAYRENERLRFMVRLFSKFGKQRKHSDHESLVE